MAFGAAGAGWQPLVGSWEAATSVASVGVSGEASHSLALSQFAFSDVDLAHAVSLVLAGMAHPAPTLPSFAEPPLVEPQSGAVPAVVDPRVLDQVDLEHVALESSRPVDDQDLTAISHAAGSPGASDIVFSEAGLLEVLS